MYFKFEGSFDAETCVIDLANFKEIKKETFLKILNAKNTKITEFLLDGEVNKLKEKARYYDSMHPKMLLTEDFVENSINDAELKKLFNKFFYPLKADTCPVFIMDPYIIAKNTNVNLFVDIIKENVKSKELKIVRNSKNDEKNVFNNIDKKLKSDGFKISYCDRSDLHDRWWFTRKNGFTVGTSFNGLTRRNTLL